MAASCALALRNVPRLLRNPTLLAKKPSANVFMPPKFVAGTRPIATATASGEQQQQQQQQQAETTATHEAVPVKTEQPSRRELATRQYSPLAPLSDFFDPWFPRSRSLTQMLDSFDRIFDDAMMAPFGRFPSLLRSPLSSTLGGAGALSRPSGRMPWDIQESKDGYHLRIDMPGLSKDEVSVKLQDGSLTIKGEHKSEEKRDEGEEGGIWDSRIAKSYQTTLALPDNILEQDIRAEMKNGVLTVTLRKKEAEQPTSTAMEISVQ
eukprot:TRINITY_DN2675_c0_g2_i2.p1 TRINITY_DN2675_c0_g2~~TRINITY_DN2675_c0_g2_i2.p1  ORF type:complete len:264 (-),score=24.78 TRINITY_DN2675_c0_g2_i2:217-1008(-)